MRAILVKEFGDAEVMQVGEVRVPDPAPDEILVRILAAGVGPWDDTASRAVPVADGQSNVNNAELACPSMLGSVRHINRRFARFCAARLRRP